MGFVFGTLCLVGLFFLFAGGRRRRWHHRHHHGHHHHAHGGCGGRRRGRRWERDERDEEDSSRWAGDGFVRNAKRGLNLREEQVAFVDDALKDARKAVENFAADLRESRDDLASAVTGETIDDARLDAVFAWHDDSLRQVRKDVVDAIKKVHAALDPDQRSKLANLFDSAAGRWV